MERQRAAELLRSERVVGGGVMEWVTGSDAGRYRRKTHHAELKLMLFAVFLGAAAALTEDRRGQGPMLAERLQRRRTSAESDHPTRMQFFIPE